MHAKCLHEVWFCDSIDLFLENKTSQGVWIMLTVFFWSKVSLDIVYFSLTLHIQVLLLFPQGEISFEQGQNTCHVQTNRKHNSSALPAPLFLEISQLCGRSVRVGLPGGRHKRALCSWLMIIGGNSTGLSEAMWGDGLHWMEARMSCILLEDGEREVTPSPLLGSSMTSSATVGGNWVSWLPVHVHVNGSLGEQELATVEHFSLMSSSTLILLLGNLWKVKDRPGEKKIETKHIHASFFCTRTFPKYWGPHGSIWGLHTWWSEGSLEKSHAVGLVFLSLCVVKGISWGVGILSFGIMFYGPIGPCIL